MMLQQISVTWRELRRKFSKPLAFSLLAMGVLSTVGLITLEQYFTNRQQIELAYENLYRVRAALEDSFFKRTSLGIALNAFVQARSELDLNKPADELKFRNDFERFTQSLENQVPGVISLQLAPQGVVMYVTQVNRNQSAIGFDLLKQDKQRAQILENIRSRSSIVAGPLSLLQGGDAIIVRQPVFLSPSSEPRLGTRQTVEELPTDFWGFATVIIDPTILYQESGLLSKPGRYSFALKGRHGLGKEGELFFGDASVFRHATGRVNISIPHGEWVLAIEMTQQGLSWRSFLIAFLGISLSGLICFNILDKQASEVELVKLNSDLMIANDLKDEFLAMISHELRTPLNAILGLSEGLKEQIHGKLEFEQINALQTIENSGQHLLRLINDILDLSRMQARQVDLDLRSVYLPWICQTVAHQFQPRLQAKSLSLEMNFMPNFPNLEVDEMKFSQVLEILLDNAVKFTPERGRIELELHQLSTYSEPRLSLSLKDSGIGIAKNQMHKLFEPFSQIDSALNRQYNGTGLGLALVHRLIELQGGTISVESEIGLGSTFTVELPFHVSNEDATNQSVVEQSEESVPINDAVEKPLVLLAEDNAANVVTMSSYLRAKGFRLVLAQNGREAIAQAKSENPDLILMDIQMPVMDGLEAIQHIREDSSLQKTPIVALTALAMKGDRERCLKAGADDYLSKPIKLKYLVSTIRKLLAVA